MPAESVVGPGHRPGPTTLIGVAALGVVCGAGAQGTAAIEGSLLELTAVTGIWVAITVALGCFSPNLSVAALRSMLFLVGAVITFYAVGWVFHDYLTHFPIIAFWLLSSAIGGPALGITGWMSTQANWRGSAALSLIVALLLGEALRKVLQGGFLGADWLPIVFNILVSLLYFWFAPADSRRRIQAAALLPALLAVATIFFLIALPWLMQLVVPL